MSQTTFSPTQQLHLAITRQPTLLAGVALSSFAALLLELALTRLFSVVLFYHYAFLAISVALLGLGAGGVFAHLLREKLRRSNLRRLATNISLLWCFAVLIALEVILRVPVRLQLDVSNFRRLSLMYLVTAVPFFLTGILFSVIFARNSQQISRLYGADLCGGALACVATVPLLNYLGGPNTILLAAAVMALAAVIWNSGRSWLIIAGSVLTSLVVLIALNSSHPSIDIIYAKGLYRDPSWVEYARWNAISRIEVDRHYDGSKWIVIDADASTAIMSTDPHHLGGTEWEASLMNSAPAMSNLLRPHGTFAIIGPGGGVDVLRAVANGSPRVTGIEINPIIVNDVMRGRYADYARHLYELPEVDIHVSDGRSFIRNSSDTYDVVQMTLVDTWASTAAGAFALSENNLYTVEAFKDYFRHLKPDGLIAITRWEFKEPREALRVVSVAIQALHELGVLDPARNFIVVSDGSPDVDGRPVLVLGKRSAFTAEEISIASDHLRRHPHLTPQYVPGQPADSQFAQLIRSNDPAAFALDYNFNVAPVYDNAPFFFFTLKLGQVLAQSVDEGMDWKVNVGVAVLGMVLLLSVGAVLAFLIVPLVVGTRGQHSRLLPLTYFIAIGLGYIIVEIAFVQRFVLFLGHPTYALTVVVFLMLLSSGAGSLLSRRFFARPLFGLWPLLAIVSVLVGYVFLLPALLPALIGLPFAVKLLISGLLLVPLGFAMGMPFPGGLRVVAGAPSAGLPSGDATSENSVEWAWAMNAASSVLGSVLAIVIAIRFGFNITLACGAAAYLVAALLIGHLEASPREHLTL
jgi:spermidine synthase